MPKKAKTKKRSDNLDLRDGVYYADFYVGGRRIRRSLKTSDYEAAKQAVAALVEQVWKSEKLGVSTVTFAHAAVEYLNTLDSSSKPPRTLEEKRSKIRWLVEKLGMSMLVRDVTADTVYQLIQQRRDEGVVFKTKQRRVSDLTINRYLSELSVVLRFARARGWIAAVPEMEKSSEKDSKRTRWLTQEQAAKLVAELPEHLVPIVRFSLATGLRRTNATLLRWDQVSLAQRICWVFSEDAKGKKSFRIPLSDEAMAILKQQVGKHDDWCFPYEGGPLLNPASGAWHKALKRAGITDFHWHDLRHTWATWHVQNGTPLGVLQQLGAWSSYEMVLRYAIFAPDHIAQFANNSVAPALSM